MLRVAGALPRRHRQAIARVSVSALVASLPLLYVSLLRPPPAALAGDTAFWFLMSNCVIAAIVATADDAGTLFSGPKDDDDPCHVIEGAVVVPSAEPSVVTMQGGGGVAQQEVAASSHAATDLVASPFLIRAEHNGDAANEPGTDDLPDHMHASVLPQRHEAGMKPITSKNSTAAVPVMAVEGGQGEEVGEIAATPTPPASGDRALAEPPEPEPEPEPWVVPKLVTSRSLPDQEVQEEEVAWEEWPVPLYSRPPDVLAQDKGAAAGRDGRLQRSATEGSKSPAAEESEYWELTDEELNRRVEDFIARFNRQIEQEAGV